MISFLFSKLILHCSFMFFFSLKFSCECHFGVLWVAWEDTVINDYVICFRVEVMCLFLTSISPLPPAQ